MAWWLKACISSNHPAHFATCCSSRLWVDRRTYASGNMFKSIIPVSTSKNFAGLEQMHMGTVSD